MKESKYTKELLEQNVKLVSNMSDLVRKLTASEKAHGSMTDFIKNKLKSYNIDFSHFSRKSPKGKVHKSNSKEYLLENYFCNPSKLYTGSSVLKKWLFKYNMIEEKCSQCNIGNMWNNEYLSLQLDHIDGNNKNNDLSNLRILCPNCHSQTHNYAGKKKRIIIGE